MKQPQLPSTVQAPAIASGEARDPAALYQALRAQRHELTQQLDELEQASEVTALEVERIGEGQRFLTRLLTEKESVRLGNAESQRLLPDQSATR